MKAIGIDLGTTNSVAAYCEPGTRMARVLPTRSGENFTPSVVGKAPSQGAASARETLVGRPAFNNSPYAPQDTVYSIKRLMGRDYADQHVEKMRERHSYRIVAAPQGGAGVCVQLGDETLTPPEISARILSQIKEDASRALADEVTHAIITVPAYFNERQRAATLEAGRLAGLTVPQIISEPTAAAIAFGMQVRTGEHRRVLVFDLGGGTFDISILELIRGEGGHDDYQELGIDGNPWLGGDDLDAWLVQKIADSVRLQQHLDPPPDPRFRLLAKQQAEKAKIALSYATSADIDIAAAFSHAGLPVDVRLTVTEADLRNEIDALFVGPCLSLVETLLQEQGLAAEDIDDVLMVGGSTLIPRVFEAVQRRFGASRVLRTVNPMECVALGAAILAAKLDVAITPVTAVSLGIEVKRGDQGDVFEQIIPKGTPYPLREPKRRVFRPGDPRMLRVPVFEGDDPVASRNERIGTVEYRLAQDIGLDAEVEVGFDFDVNRTLTVTLSVKGTQLKFTDIFKRGQNRSLAAAESAQERLKRLMARAREFSDNYGDYLERDEKARLERDVAAGGLAAASPDETAAKQHADALVADLLSSSVASQLFLASVAANGASPEFSAKLARVVTEIKAAHAAREAEAVKRLAGTLRPLVEQEFQRRHGLEAAAGAKGILKTLLA